MADTIKNPPEFYGIDYLKSIKASMAYNLGQEHTTRWDDNGTFYGTAMMIDTIMKALGQEKPSKILDIGCGRGFGPRHMRNLGWDADGCEYSDVAIEHGVIDLKKGDLTEKLPYPDDFAFMSVCLGVLSHLPEPSVMNALRELRRVSKHLWTNILVGPHKLQQHHLTVLGPTWWREKFIEAGWNEMTGMAETLKSGGFNTRDRQWSSVWIG